jgi:ABC-type multidrug transport system permease subunit
VLGFFGILLAWMPSDPLFDTLSQVIPHYWANAAFQDLFVRGQGLVDIVPSLLALSGFTVVFLAVGLWRFEYE